MTDPELAAGRQPTDGDDDVVAAEPEATTDPPSVDEDPVAAEPEATTDPPSVDEDPESGDTRDTGESAGGRTSVPLVAFVTAAVAAVLFGVVALVAVLSSSDSAEAVRGPREAAARFAELLFTFDATDLEPWEAALLASSTGGFAQEFEQVQGGLRAAIEERGVDGRAEAREVFVADVDGGEASAIVILDYRLEGPDGIENVSDEPIRLELVRVDGRWLVADVSTIGGGGPIGGLG